MFIKNLLKSRVKKDLISFLLFFTLGFKLTSHH